MIFVNCVSQVITYKKTIVVYVKNIQTLLMVYAIIIIVGYLSKNVDIVILKNVLYVTKTIAAVRYKTQVSVQKSLIANTTRYQVVATNAKKAIY